MSMIEAVRPEFSHPASLDEMQQSTPEGYELRLLSVTLVNYLLSKQEWSEKVTVIRETEADTLLVYVSRELSSQLPH